MIDKVIVLSSCCVVLAAATSAQDAQCTQMRDVGDTSCGAPGGIKWFHDTRTKHCQPFSYKGCGGSANRFDSKEDCEKACSGVTNTAAAPRAVCKSTQFAATDSSGQALACSACPSNYACEEGKCCPNKEATCSFAYDAGKFGPGGVMTPRYFYNTDRKNCMLFTYFGNQGNANNFRGFRDCEAFCME